MPAVPYSLSAQCCADPDWTRVTVEPHTYHMLGCLPACLLSTSFTDAIRVALLPRYSVRTSPGVQQAPYGCVAAVFIHVVGAATLAAWNSEVANVSSRLELDRRSLCKIHTCFHLKTPASAML